MPAPPSPTGGRQRQGAPHPEHLGGPAAPGVPPGGGSRGPAGSQPGGRRWAPTGGEQAPIHPRTEGPFRAPRRQPQPGQQVLAAERGIVEQTRAPCYGICARGQVEAGGKCSSASPRAASVGFPPSHLPCPLPRGLLLPTGASPVPELIRTRLPPGHCSELGMVFPGGLSAPQAPSHQLRMGLEDERCRGQRGPHFTQAEHQQPRYGHTGAGGGCRCCPQPHAPIEATPARSSRHRAGAAPRTHSSRCLAAFCSQECWNQAGRGVSCYLGCCCPAGRRGGTPRGTVRRAEPSR